MGDGKVTIESDGTPEGTTVKVGGVELTTVTGIEWRMVGQGDSATMTIRLTGCPVWVDKASGLEYPLRADLAALPKDVKVVISEADATPGIGRAPTITWEPR